MVSSRDCLHVASLTFLSVNLLTADAFSTTTNNRIIRNQNAVPFSITQKSDRAIAPTTPQRIPPPTTTTLSMTEDENTPTPKRTTNTRLLAESIAPWRTLRLFLYFSLGAGALLSGFINLTGVFATLSNASPIPSTVPISSQYTDVAIDFAFVLLFGIAAKLDLDKGAELDDRVKARFRKSKESKALAKGMVEREGVLGELELELRVDEEGTMQRAAVAAVQSGAGQHVILVAGPRKAVRDALLGANLLKMEFSLRDVLVVPYEVGGKRRLEEEGRSRPDGGGFGEDSRPMWETQPYVANAVGDGWQGYIEAEMEDAVKQNGDKAREEGIAIIVANTGEIVRRGVGQVPWRNIVEELEKKVKEEDPLDLGFLSG